MIMTKKLTEYERGWKMSAHYDHAFFIKNTDIPKLIEHIKSNKGSPEFINGRIDFYKEYMLRRLLKGNDND